MKNFLLLTLFCSLYCADDGGTHTPPSGKIPVRRDSTKSMKRQPSQEDIEKALDDIEKLKKNKYCCKISRAQVALISSAISTVTTAGITIATMYANCNVPKND